MITIRPIEDVTQIHPELSRWWTGHGWPAVPVAVLNAGLGFLAEDGNQPIAYACLYMANRGGVSMLEWLVADPNATGRQTISAIARLLPFICNEAKEMNYGIVLSTCRQEGVGRMLEHAGFEKTDSNVSHYLRIAPVEVEA